MTQLSELATLDGLITPEIGETLYGLANGVPADRAIVEIGSYKGKSTAYLAEGSRRGARAHVYAIDPWEDLPVGVWCRRCEQPTFKAFREQLESVDLMHMIWPIQSTSDKIAAKWHGPPIGLLYVDGGHDYRTVLEDLLGWLPHLHPERVVAVDDYGATVNPDVARAVDRIVRHGQLVLTEILHGRLALLR